MAALKAGDCRYCVADAPVGEMHRALFCAAPVSEGPYCAEHSLRCRLPNREDLDALAAEIETAIAPRD